MSQSFVMKKQWDDMPLTYIWWMWIMWMYICVFVFHNMIQVGRWVLNFCGHVTPCNYHMFGSWLNLFWSNTIHPLRPQQPIEKLKGFNPQYMGYKSCNPQKWRVLGSHGTWCLPSINHRLRRQLVQGNVPIQPLPSKHVMVELNGLGPTKLKLKHGRLLFMKALQVYDSCMCNISLVCIIM